MNNESNCIVAQSGGPTTVINSSLAGVVSCAQKSGEFNKILGCVNGITGILSNNVIDFTNKLDENPLFIDCLKLSPAMYLGSCRYKLSSDTKHKDYQKIFEYFKSENITCFFYIGGNDSMDTVDKLSSYAKTHNIDIKIIGIPKTIDNDLVLTDHTPGFGSAAKYIATSILEIAHDAYIYNTKSVTIVEIMGRNAGWLTAASALARNNYSFAPHLIYLPERAFDKEQFLNDIKNELNSKNHVIIAVSEGIKNKNGEYISADSKDIDEFGHVCLAGTGKYLENLVKNKIGCKVRSIELNVLQRCAGHILSKTDVDEAFKLGEKAVELALEGNTGIMVSITRTKNIPYTYEITYQNIDKIANKEKKIPQEWINQDGNDITNDLLEYLKPLILGETNISYIDGIPSYLPVSHLIK